MANSDLEMFLRRLLPKAARKFCARQNHHRVSEQEDECGYHGAKDHSAYCDAWFELSGLDEQYASIGFETPITCLYWTVPKPAWGKFADFVAKDYQEEKTYLWKSVRIPKGLISKNDKERERAIYDLTQALLEEDEKLRGA